MVLGYCCDRVCGWTMSVWGNGGGDGGGGGGGGVLGYPGALNSVYAGGRSSGLMPNWNTQEEEQS